MTSKTPVGFQLFIYFVSYYELYCLVFHSRRHRVAVLNLSKVSNVFVMMIE